MIYLTMTQPLDRQNPSLVGVVLRRERTVNRVWDRRWKTARKPTLPRKKESHTTWKFLRFLIKILPRD
tara:strand:+ start:26 stop:229 length:204 start_codon:yes stop_codon:yes gene_type:complete